jgi:hypothetical protein
MSVLARATWCDIPEDGILHSHHGEILKSFIVINKFAEFGEKKFCQN